MLKTKTLFFACMLFFCCSKEESVPKPYFKIIIDAKYETSESENWIVLHDKDNNLLAAKPFEAGENFVFDSTVVIDQPFVVSLFRFSQGPNNVHFNIETYSGVAPKAEWKVLPVYPTAGDYGTGLGEHEVTLSDADLGYFYNSGISNKFTSYSHTKLTDESFRYNARITSTLNDYFLFATGTDGVPKYAFLEDLAAGGKQTISLANLKPFDKTVKVTFPGLSDFSYVVVRALEENQPYVRNAGYYLNLYLEGISGGSYSSYQVGYLNRFNRYQTVISADITSEYGVSYEAYGAAPAADITLKKADVSLTNKTFQNFAIAGTDFEWRSTQFYDYPSLTAPWVTWTFFSGNNDLTNYTLPTEFTKRYPQLSTSNLKHSSSNFRKGISFEQFLEEKFSSAEPKNSIVTGTMLK
ncbi:MAG TPA: hypothetical protein VGD40_09325 [Chryseosolibacter sp.]